MEKIRTALVWARAHKRLVLTVTATAGTLAASRIPGFPAEKLTALVAALLGV